MDAYETSIERAVCEFPNHGKIIEALLSFPHQPEKILENCRITPGIPIKPMLAKPTTGIKVIFQRFDVRLESHYYVIVIALEKEVYL